MSEENIFKKLSLMKNFHHPKGHAPRGCQFCISGLVHVRHSITKHAYVYRCKCLLGQNRREAYAVWDNNLDFEPL